MGCAGWFHWFSERVEKLKLARSLATSEEEKKVLDELIAEAEAELNK